MHEISKPVFSFLYIYVVFFFFFGSRHRGEGEGGEKQNMFQNVFFLFKHEPRTCQRLREKVYWDIFGGSGREGDGGTVVCQSSLQGIYSLVQGQS